MFFLILYHATKPLNPEAQASQVIWLDSSGVLADLIEFISQQKGREIPNLESPKFMLFTVSDVGMRVEPLSQDEDVKFKKLLDLSKIP